MSCHLRGLSVLVTRPEAQADGLCELIEQAHGRPVRFPAMEIQPLTDPDAAQLLQQLAQTDLLIFISANAVQYAFPLLPDELPIGLQIAALGRATAFALEEVGLSPDLMPEKRFDSEGLLALPMLQEMAGKRVVIVRGEGGRELLKSTLEARGARVDYAEVYRRSLPRRNPANLIAGWGRLVDVVTATSSQLLDNLWALLGVPGQALLKETPLVVLSRRTAEHAQQLGCRKVYLAEEASDRGILRTLCRLAEP